MYKTHNGALVETSYKVTDEVNMNNTTIFVVRVNGEMTCFVHSEQEVKLVIDSIANATANSIKNRRVYREETGNSIKIITQNEGWAWNGAPKVKMEIDYVEVGQASVIKNRLALPEVESEASGDTTDCVGSVGSTGTPVIPPAPPAPRLPTLEEMRKWGVKHDLPEDEYIAPIPRAPRRNLNLLI